MTETGRQPADNRRLRRYLPFQDVAYSVKCDDEDGEWILSGVVAVAVPVVRVSSGVY